LTAGYYGARVATHMDAPKIEVIFVESDDGLGPFGAKSMGESSKVPAPARWRTRSSMRSASA
jgi:Aerobic-type carbon monoxide dehydrogenase, large subunit CoxL/CutL homologs